MKRLIICLLCILVMSGCSLHRDPYGTWEDSSTGYRVQISADGIIDNNLGLPMNGSIADNLLQYTTPAGDVIQSEVRFDGGSTMFTFIGGSVRKLVRCSNDDLGDTLWAKPAGDVDSSRVFSRKSAVGPEQLVLSDDGRFTLSHGQEEMSGVAVQGEDGVALVLYYHADSDNMTSEVLLYSPSMDMLYGYPLSVDGVLEVTPKYLNKAAETPSGYLLDGVVMYSNPTTTFSFSSDGKCSKCSDGVRTVVYNYSISSNGLVTLSDENGVLAAYDYLYYNASANTIYRVVFESSSWSSFLKHLLEQKTTEDTHLGVSYSVTSPPIELLYGSLKDSYVANAKEVWGSLEEEDAKYTSSVCSEIASELERIQADDIARREYEQSLMSERERFLEQMRLQEEEARRVQAEMDARAQAAIAESQASASGYGSVPYEESSDAGYTVDSG